MPITRKALEDKKKKPRQDGFKGGQVATFENFFFFFFLSAGLDCLFCPFHLLQAFLMIFIILISLSLSFPFFFKVYLDCIYFGNKNFDRNLYLYNYKILK